ncbi:MAG: cyclase family protein [Mycobacterium sp.]
MCLPSIISAADKDKIAAYAAKFREVSRSPFGADDEIGMLNLIDPKRSQELLARADVSRAFDLSVDLFMGMPSWVKAGDPPFQQWMTHTPSGTVLDDYPGVGPEQNQLVSYSGDAISMYTHTGTHIDTLNHFGYNKKIWNGFTEVDHLSSRHWIKCGADKLPPIISRAVLFDVAALHGVDVLPDNYGIGADDLENALRHQGTSFYPGDIAIIRTGRMRRWPDAAAYIDNSPGLNLDGATYLAQLGASMIGADNSALEQMPADDPENWQVVHTYLLAEAGVPIMELVDCEAISAEREFEFVFIGASLKIRGATGAPIRPLALPIASR